MPNKVKPTPKQRAAFENIKRGMTKKDAMLKAGYSEKSALMAKQNLLETRGYEELIKEYRKQLYDAGITTDVLAEVQAEGLFDQDARVRLEYLKENKKDFGLVPNQNFNLTQVNIELPDWAK